MRITIVQGPYFPVPPLLASGVEKMWFGLGSEFARRGHQVVHLSRQYPGLAPEEVIAGVAHRRIRSFDAPRSKVLYRALDLIYSLRARRALPMAADILVTNCMWLPLLVRSRRRGALYVHVARYPKGQMWLYRHAPRIQTVSTAMRTAITAELGAANAGQLRVIPPFVTNLPAPSTALPEALRREPIVLYVGRIHPEKGVHHLLRAFRQSGREDWRLWLIGPSEHGRGGGGAGYRRELEAIAAGDARIEFLGMVDQAALNRALETASILAYPSLAERGESFGAVPVEAMGRGCPVIVSDLACFRDYLEPEANGLVFNHREGDPSGALSLALRRMMADGALRQRLARAGRETAQRFALSEVADRFLADFAELSGAAVEPGPRPPSRIPA